MPGVSRIFVVGAGTMGHGIAEVAALRGFSVTLYDIKQEFLDGALSRIRWSLERLAERGTIGSPDEVMSRISTTLDLESGASGADFVIEAAPERMEVKRDIFSRLDRSARPGAVLATNTSSLPITEISESVSEGRRGSVVGMHFFNPPVIMQLVEVVRGSHTSDAAVGAAYDLARALGKQPVIVSRDVPGFIVNRIMARFLNAACSLVERGIYGMEQVDAAARHSLGMPMGAFELSDYIGMDVLDDIIRAMVARGFRMRPCGLFGEARAAGRLGVKSGRGFYEHPGAKFRKPELDPSLAGAVDPVLLIAPAVNEAAYLLREGVASRDDIDKAVRLGLNYPRGIFEYADQYGPGAIASALRRLEGLLGSDEYEPDPLILEIAGRGGRFYPRGPG
ncbi:MAG: 3-hydroxyacyl-CoA dehydrogenase NAD-binding domain-containing protein [Nitrososphaeria archaeon]